MIRIYYRVSTDKQDFDMQYNAIRNLLKSNCVDYDLCEVYRDFGLSGTTNERPDYQKLLHEVESNDTIVVYEYSRLWRDMEEQTRTINQLLSKDVSFLSVVDGEINKNTGKLFANIKGSINEFEADRLRQRIKAGIAAKKANIAAGLDTWKVRGPDKQPRKKDGYLNRGKRARGEIP